MILPKGKAGRIYIAEEMRKLHNIRGALKAMPIIN